MQNFWLMSILSISFLISYECHRCKSILHSEIIMFDMFSKYYMIMFSILLFLVFSWFESRSTYGCFYRSRNPERLVNVVLKLQSVKLHYSSTLVWNADFFFIKDELSIFIFWHTCFSPNGIYMCLHWLKNPEALSSGQLPSDGLCFVLCKSMKCLPCTCGVELLSHRIIVKS